MSPSVYGISRLTCAMITFARFARNGFRAVVAVLVRARQLDETDIDVRDLDVPTGLRPGHGEEVDVRAELHVAEQGLRQEPGQEADGVAELWSNGLVSAQQHSA